MRRYYSLNDYCRREFGKKLYKLSVDGGMTCPNRDGTKSSGGCRFCSESGSGEFAQKPMGSVTEQLKKAVDAIAAKNRGGGYIAYFQSFTNTYAPVDYLRRIFTEALSFPGVEALSIATRPDCLGSEVMSLLGEISEKIPLWVELGLQTSREDTAKYLNRGFDNSVYARAVKMLNEKNIKVVTHVILGLPGEKYEDMEQSVRFACECGTWGIKLHMLYVQSDAPIARDYREGLFSCFTKEEYLDTVCRLIKIIPPAVVIHRLTGDGDKKTLIAPLWSGNKKDVLNSLTKIMEENNIIQGSDLTTEEKNYFSQKD